MTTTAPRVKRAKTFRETPEYAAMVARMIRAHGKRVANGNLEDLAELVAMRDQLDETIAMAANGLHEHHSWTEIGGVLGVSRQAARQAAQRAASKAARA